MIGKVKHTINSIVYKCLYYSGLLAHKTHLNWDTIKTYSLTTEELHPVFVGSSSLFFIDSIQVRGYFRPIMPHVSFRGCVLDSVEDFYTNVHPEHRTEQALVKQALKEKKRFKKFLNMGSFNDPYSRARKFYLTKDPEVVGIPKPVNLISGSEEWKRFINNIHALLKYVKNSMTRYDRNRRGGDIEYSSVNRIMGTEAVARLLGLEDLFPRTDFAIIRTPENEYKGTLMSISEGESTNRISRSRSYAVASPALQRDLNRLNIIDAITFERDHRPGNYMVILDEKGKAKGISVYDNDAILTFAPLGLSHHSGSGCSNIVKNRAINRPHMDKSLANSVLLLKKEDLDRALKPYLNGFQLAFCWGRVVSLKRAIRKSMIKDHFLLDEEGWTEDTMNEELSGQWGRTYLKYFLDFEEISKSFFDFAHAADF